MTEKEAQQVPAPPSWKNVRDSDDEEPKPLVARGHYNVTTERILPLRQLATYCRFAETRYFFLVTQDEVVVFRVRRIDEKELASQGPPAQKARYAGFEFKSIPWDASGTSRLSFNLAVWALACMGMNDHHREMEGPGSTPLEGMARLTHWVEDKVNGEYTNVISGRVIKKEDWAKRKTDFVKLTAASGYSKTKDFYRTDTGSLATQLGVMSLGSGQSSSKASSGATGVPTGRPSTPTSSKAPQPQASTGGSPSRNPANTPAPPKPRTSPPGAPTSNRTGNRTGTPAPAGAQGQRGSPASPSRSATAAPAPQAVTATFKGKKYAVTMKDGLLPSQWARMMSATLNVVPMVRDNMFKTRDRRWRSRSRSDGGMMLDVQVIFGFPCRSFLALAVSTLAISILCPVSLFSLFSLFLTVSYCF